ncbi:hypothetical protein [Rhodococcus opacus]|uniref:hypothetical protein n=1 Tax=Rhodococcus opacus TaxID=37919 RepID=UPI0024749DF8|nr:hypothetical protein [Rhodococcus opacus]MDH6293283.1 hypothetical protein [Rhodococcus opacus]
MVTLAFSVSNHGWRLLFFIVACVCAATVVLLLPPDWRKRLGPPTAVVIAASSALSVFLVTPDTTQQEPTATACRNAHPEANGTQMKAETQSESTSFSVSTFEGCAWPPRSGTDSIGYWEVVVHTYPIPGAAAAGRFTDIEIFDTGCEALGLDYLFRNQGSFAHTRYTVQTHQIVDGQTGKGSMPMNSSLI